MPDLVENAEVIEVLVLGEDGSAVPLGRTESAVLIDAAGGRQFVERRFIMRTGDGCLVQDTNTALVACACGQLLTQSGVVSCARCAHAVCRSHAHAVPEFGPAASLCDACWTAAKRTITWRRWLSWLTNLD